MSTYPQVVRIDRRQATHIPLMVRHQLVCFVQHRPRQYVVTRFGRRRFRDAQRPAHFQNVVRQRAVRDVPGVSIESNAVATDVVQMDL